MNVTKRRTFSEDTLRLHAETSAKKFRALTVTPEPAVVGRVCAMCCDEVPAVQVCGTVGLCAEHRCAACDKEATYAR